MPISACSYVITSAGSSLKDVAPTTSSPAEHAARREGVEWEFEERMRASSVDFAPQCVESVASAASDLGYDAMRISSGAGHDATHLAGVCDTGMVFAVSENGKSHSEEEFTSWSDCYAAANTLANAASGLADGDATGDTD